MLRRRVLIAVLVIAALLAPAKAESTATLEYRVKLGFLYNFLKFIEWPDQSGPYKLCVLGESPFGPALQQLPEKQGSGLAIEVREIKALVPGRERELATCNLLFIASSQSDKLAIALTTINGSPVVTVSDDDPAAAITFRLIEGRVRFSFNQEAMKKIPVKVSSKLLSLAAPSSGG